MTDRNARKTMKALVLVADGVLDYREVPFPPKPGDEWILVRMAYAGLCGSDIPRAFGGRAYHYPLIMGHELSGTVEESFGGAPFAAGDRVVVYPLLPCRRCAACQTGDFAQCEDYDYFGSRRDGGFAEFLCVPESNLLPVPEGLDLSAAAMTEPCAVALHGANKLHVRPGDTAAVFGGGPIGTMVAQWLRIRGCERVFIVEIEAKKIATAREMGFLTIDATESDPVQTLRQATDGWGADRVVEACGTPATFLQAVRSAARFAEVVFLGNIQGEFRIGEKDFSNILRKELVIYGTWNSRFAPSGRDDWSVSLRHLGRQIHAAPLISHVVDLADAKAALQDVANGRFGFYNKIVFKISG